MEDTPIWRGLFQVVEGNYTSARITLTNESLCVDCRNGSSCFPKLERNVVPIHSAFTKRFDETDRFDLYLIKKKTKLGKSYNLNRYKLKGNDVESIKRVTSQLRIEIRTKPLLIFINPKSGSGKSEKIFREEVEPLLRAASIEFRIEITKDKKSTHTLLSDLHLSSWSGIVVIGGDGLLFQIFQGLASRTDWKETAHLIPIGIIPGGSGNGLVHSLLRRNGENHRDPLLPSINNVLHGSVKPMDLVEITTESQKRYFSFLSIGWGLFTDIDIESESMRFFGGDFRFFIYSLVRIAKLREYYGEVTYEPISSSDRKVQTITGKFILVFVSYQSMIGSKICMSLESQLDDGIMWLTMIRSGISKRNLTDILLKIDENHSFKDCPHVECIPVKSFSLNPIERGYLVIDGESVQCEPCRAEIIKSYARIMCKN